MIFPKELLELSSEKVEGAAIAFIEINIPMARMIFFKAFLLHFLIFAEHCSQYKSN